MTTKNRQSHSIPNAGYPHHYQTYLPQYHHHQNHSHHHNDEIQEINHRTSENPKTTLHWTNSTEEQSVFLLATIAIIYAAADNRVLKGLALVVGVLRSIPLKTVKPAYANIFWFLGYAAWLSHLGVSLYLFCNV